MSQLEDRNERPRPGSPLWWYIWGVVIAAAVVTCVVLGGLRRQYLSELGSSPAFWLVALPMAVTALRPVVPKGRSGEAEYATKVTPSIIGFLESYFGMPYPYEKMDQIAVPRKGGAMENAGLITYGLPLLLIPNDELTISRKKRSRSCARPSTRRSRSRSRPISRRSRSIARRCGSISWSPRRSSPSCASSPAIRMRSFKR